LIFEIKLNALLKLPKDLEPWNLYEKNYVREVKLHSGNELDPKSPLYFNQNSTTDPLKVQQYLH